MHVLFYWLYLALSFLQRSNGETNYISESNVGVKTVNNFLVHIYIYIYVVKTSALYIYIHLYMYMF